MNFSITKWIRIYFLQIKESIAFYPAIIAVAFLVLSYVMLGIDFSEWGKSLKSDMTWLSLKDASTARSIISTVAGALISLTVFSFSMVMIVLNQAASQMSNRVLSSMIENRFQQTVLGFYIGTIVYALFLLTTIRDIDSGIYVPALSIYLLILLTVVDIFLFIYFLDYVTQSVKYETIIDRVEAQTSNTMGKTLTEQTWEEPAWTNLPFVEIKVLRSDYFQGFNQKRMLAIAKEKNLYISILLKQTSYNIRGTVFAKVYSLDKISDDCIEELTASADFYSGQPIDRTADYGFRQLAEIAIKALSPGINDPATAVLAINSLSDLFLQRLYCNVPSILSDDQNTARIHVPTSTFEELFIKCIYPIYSYGKSDLYIQNALLEILGQLKVADSRQLYTDLFSTYENRINAEIITV